jgi:hypothetical protein
MIVTRSMGLWVSRQARKYVLPFLWLPSMGSSLTVVLPPSPSSITQYPSPSARRNTPGQRTSIGNLPPVSGSEPQVLESP